MPLPCALAVVRQPRRLPVPESAILDDAAEAFLSPGEAVYRVGRSGSAITGPAISERMVEVV